MPPCIMVEIIHIIPDKSPEIEKHGVITQTEHQHDQDTVQEKEEIIAVAFPVLLTDM